ncbi:MAG: hypothetical protein HY537_01410 [Deltaproteobacteria bacterium]|nr:hypothetical protein [Deltaproteobacteria bacterium]
MRQVTLFAFLLISAVAQSSTIPKNLSANDVNRVVEILGLGNTMRLLRSAEAYDFYPGIKLGLEIPVTLARDINDLGDQTGSIPGLFMMPRIFVSKGLFLNLEISFNYFPGAVFNTLSTFGTLLKWSFFEEKEKWAAVAVYGAYTRLSGLDDAYSGRNFELGLVASKDYVRVKPYLGVGMLFVNGVIATNFVRTAENSAWQSTLHVFGGAEIEYPVNITIQLDLMNLSPMGTLFIGKKF